MRQDAAGQTDGDALDALREQQRELHRQRDRLLVAPVVARRPGRDLGSEDHVERELAQPRLDVSRRRRVVAGEDVAPVALGVDEQILLPELHHRVADAGIAVRMILHRVADHVRDLVVAAVVQLVQRVHDAPLHRLQAVVDVRHRALEDDVARVVEEPVRVVLVHQLGVQRRVWMRMRGLRLPDGQVGLIRVRLFLGHGSGVR